MKLLREFILGLITFSILWFVFNIIMGCGATIGNNKVLTTPIEQQVIIGQTTPDQIRSLLGEPQNTYFIPHQNSGITVWRYGAARSRLKGASYIPFFDITQGGISTTTRVIDIFFYDGIVFDIRIFNNNKLDPAPIGTLTLLGAVAVGTTASLCRPWPSYYNCYQPRYFYPRYYYPRYRWCR